MAPFLLIWSLHFRHSEVQLSEADAYLWGMTYHCCDQDWCLADKVWMCSVGRPGRVPGREYSNVFIFFNGTISDNVNEGICWN
jgi:hypothetical protein